ncbi:uncharacterized protein EI97DRAFT_452500 [Westerdykella ornata]|uniref:G-patch domain-containing protein n=1 Tax=Westerdykella ornata TaxID=318751 RepID=A0A6A6JAB3_WESOR|nr:uncharacterized protein EI97DRAFT_452500 [Westerdykella ornata]KAF2273197.1 hypothetical protein EI97DRAFT_452500 [Westerdykella ornata]
MPQQIKRPQPKNVNPPKRPLAPRPQNAPDTQPTATSTPAAPANLEQRSIDYYRNTEDDDIAINEARTQQNREARRRKKEEEKFEKMYGKWDTKSEYKLKYPTNLAAYEAKGEYEEKLNDFIAYLRFHHNPEDVAEITERDLSSESNSVSPPPARDSDFAPRSGLSSTSSPLPSVPLESNMPIPRTADEAYGFGARLPQEMVEEFATAILPASEPSSRDQAQSHTSSAAVERNPLFAPPTFNDFASPRPDAVDTAQASQQTTRKPSATDMGSVVTQSATAPPAPSAPPPAVQPRAQMPVDISEQIRKAKEIAARAKRSPPPPPIVAPAEALPPPPPPPPPPTQPPAPRKAYSHTIGAPPVHYTATISADPVHYARPLEPEPKPRDDKLERPSKKQKREEPPKPSKAALMMAKMGYVKGQGLGKNNDGVTTHLEVRMRKDAGGRQNWSDDFDDDSNGEKDRIKSQQVFDITGGLRTREKDHGPFGEPSRVVVAWGCVDGVDLDQDAERDDGGIRQEMGEAFDTKFGTISRIHFDPSSATRPVYIEFANELSALNAVNRFKEGYEFQGRKIRAQYYDETKFSNMIYDH